LPRVKKEDGEGPLEQYVMGGVTDDTVYELVYDGSMYQFATGFRNADGEVELGQVWNMEGWDAEQSKDIMILPWHSDLIEKQTVVVPSKYEKYRSKTQLYQDTLAFFKRYVDLPEQENKINTHYVALSWLYDRLGELPYRRFLGDYGTGKSRALTAMLMLCFRGTVFKATATPATIFRMIERVRGTLCIDELNLSGGIQSEAFTAIESVLCAGYEKNSSVIRCVPSEGEKGYSLEAFQTFGPKVLSTRLRFKDRALESRCLTANTYRTKNPAIPVSLGEDFYKEAQSLRNQWLTFRLVNYWKPLQEAKAILELYDIEPRIRQIIAPLTRVAYRDYDFFVEYAKDQHEEAIILRQETYEGRLLSAMFDIVGAKEEDVQVEKLTNVLRDQDDTWNPRRVGGVLRSLGFRTYRKIQGERKLRYIRNTKRYHIRFMQMLDEYYLIDNGVETGQNGPSGPSKRLNGKGPDGPERPSVPSVPSQETPKPIYNCPFCDYIAPNQYVLEEHLIRIHKFQGDDEK